MDRIALIRQLNHHQTLFQEEQEFIPRFLSLLSDTPCFERTHLPGHITGSAWIVDPSCSQVLLVNHAKLNKWVQPGGHADGDENILFTVVERERLDEVLKKLKDELPTSFYTVEGVKAAAESGLIPEERNYLGMFRWMRGRNRN